MKLKTKKRTNKIKTQKNLKNICSDTIKCFAIGIHSEFIKRYFNGFDNFKLVVSPIVKIGAESGNGFIQKIHYQKNSYDAYTILKSALTSSADNIYYEYLIGQKLNLYKKYFPTFIETYGLYRYQDKNIWDISKNSTFLNKKQMEVLFLNLKNVSGNPETALISDSCENSKYMAVMIQYIKTIKFKNFFKNQHFLKYLMLPIIFQIFATLYSLRNIFTHYDLHYENVLLYEVGTNAYIEYRYHIGEKIIHFKSPYIVKIIDYGRSYFGIGNIRDELCRLCENCGEDVGYEYLFYQKNDLNSEYISPRFLNKSSDLRILYDIKRKVLNPTPHLKQMLNFKYLNKYGTTEDLTSKPGVIHNIMDAFDMISKIMASHDVLLDNEASVKGMTKFGVLEIFTDMSQEMRFIKARN